jgi:hypothetical protein
LQSLLLLNLAATSVTDSIKLFSRT